MELQGGWRLGTTTVVYLTKKRLLASDHFREGAHFIASAPGVENHSYAAATQSVIHDFNMERSVSLRVCLSVDQQG